MISAFTSFRHPYLENERCIPAEVLELERFAGRIRMDARGNAVFPHFDAEGLCGYEITNKGFTGFAAGGSKGLWFSQAKPEDNRLVFCESAIDALSHAALYPAQDTRYASIGDQVNPQQPELTDFGCCLRAFFSRTFAPEQDAERREKTEVPEEV